MLSTYLLLLIIGLAAIWLGLNMVEEVHVIAAFLTGGMLLVVAFILAPAFVQIGVGLLLLGLLQRLKAEQPRF
ncbi:MAG: hypothetical protein ACHBN1_30935 [Heteroscytonema crispum UTEX LB 1556]